MAPGDRTEGWITRRAYVSRPDLAQCSMDQGLWVLLWLAPAALWYGL
jgi:hypothetical protein